MCIEQLYFGKFTVSSILVVKWFLIDLLFLHLLLTIYTSRIPQYTSNIPHVFIIFWFFRWINVSTPFISEQMMICLIYIKAAVVKRNNRDFYLPITLVRWKLREKFFLFRTPTPKSLKVLHWNCLQNYTITQ